MGGRGSNSKIACCHELLPGCRHRPVYTTGFEAGAVTKLIPLLLIVRDESHRLSLGGLVSTIARLRFTGSVQHEMVLLIEEFSANG
jgi:hypothetical protein